MAYSYISYVGNGVTRAFAVPFGYILASEVYVSVGGVLKNATSDYNITSSYVTFATAPPAGTTVLIQRHTDVANRKVVWAAGSIVTDADLNLANLQHFYLIQELFDAVALLSAGTGIGTGTGGTPSVTPSVPSAASLIARLFGFLSAHTTITY